MTTSTVPDSVVETTPEAVVPTRTETPILSILALISAISGIVFGVVFPLSIVAIVLGIFGLRREPQARTMAIWSIVLGAVPFAIGVVIATLGIALFVPLGLFAALGGF